jgi:hypothetical protein
MTQLSEKKNKIQSKNIPKHSYFMQRGTKVILQKNMAKEYTFWPKIKALCLGKIQQYITE